MINSVHVPFKVAVVAVFMVILLPTLFQDGMFMDGLLYASVAKNLSQGIGTWWHPHFSDTFMADYHQQPPMLFWLQSFFFRIFGTSFWVERFYSLLIAIANALVISQLWKKIFSDEHGKAQFNWLPVLFWIVIPVCSFTFINNLEEGTMSLFALSSVCCILFALRDAKFKYLLFLAAGMLVLGSAFSKGIQGTFPLTVVFFYWLIFKNISFKEMIKYSTIILVLPLIIFGLLLTNHNIYESFHSYYIDRIYHTFNSEGIATTGAHFSLFMRLLIELIPVYALLLITFLTGKVKSVNAQLPSWEKKYALLFLCIGLSAVLPLMITLEQRSFYLTTSLPYFSFCFSMLALPVLIRLFSFINIKSFVFKMFLYISILVIIASGVLTIINFGHAKRDADVLKDLQVITMETGTGLTMSTTPELFAFWALQGYCMRYYNINLDHDSTSGRKYFLTEKNTGFPSRRAYRRVNLPLSRFNLYIKM